MRITEVEKSDDFMLKMISADFSVELLSRQGESAIFGALRKDVWHFVMCGWHGTNPDGSSSNANISQVHIPRYSMVVAVDTLLKMEEARSSLLRETKSLHNSTIEASIKIRLAEECSIGIRSDRSFELAMRNNVFLLPAVFCETLLQDMPLLCCGKAKVKERDGFFVLPRAKTYSGNPVSSPSRMLIEAIAFEQGLCGKLNARKFGVYSAFCTMRDFCTEMRPDCEIKEHVDGQFEYAPESISEGVMDVFMEVQNLLLSEPIWGLGLNVSREQAVKILAEGMAKLTTVQQAQFVLMNGMHGAGLFLPLAAVTELITFDQYATQMTTGYAPDSEEEQSIRAETAFIELLRNCFRTQAGNLNEPKSIATPAASEIQPREIRVFLSSTFMDMEEERNYLVKLIFPKVRAACHARQVGFTEIDLRWGVTEEESKNGATVEICLKEIDRCRDFPPFFIGFLGERYGWIPKHDELTAYWEKHSDSQYAPAIRDSIERGISVTELEMELAVLEEGAVEKIAGHALFLLRDHALTDRLYLQKTGKSPNPEDTTFYDSAAGKLNVLTDRIRNTPFVGVDGYTSVEQFGAAVEDYLLEQLDRLYPADEMPTQLQRTQSTHSVFRFQRLQHFLPRYDVRQELLDAIAQRIISTELGPVLLAGPSGQGKSALMADLTKHIEANVPDYRVIDHYIGADERNSLDAWVERILRILHPEIRDIVGDSIPEARKERVNALAGWVSLAARRNNVRYVFVLDALDQLADGGKSLDVLNIEVLGPDAIVVTSAADSTPARESARTWQTIEVPQLTDELRAAFISQTLSNYNKKLPSELTLQLAAAPQSGSPLFLGLALEELRVDARHESLTAVLSNLLTKQDAQQLFLDCFLLDEDYSRSEQPDLACRFTALLSAARAGLSEMELSDLLALPNDPIAENTGKPRLPQVHLSRLLTSFQPFLLNKEGNRAPMHRIFGEAALEHLGEVVISEQLYAHFGLEYGFDEAEFDMRGAAEALHQAIKLVHLDHHGQSVARKRLEEYLGQLSMLAQLYDKEEELVLDALQVFSHEEKSALGEVWRSHVKSLTIDELKNVGNQISCFGVWLSQRVGHYPAARAVQEPLLATQRDILGKEDADQRTILIMSGLAKTIADHGDLQTARELQETILEASRRINGEDNSKNIDAMGNLADTIRRQGDLKSAREMQELILYETRRGSGAEHPSTLAAMNNLAVTLYKQGDFQGASTIAETIIESGSRILEEDDPHLLLYMNNHASTLMELEDWTSARELLEKVFRARSRIFGAENWETIQTMGDIAFVLEKQGELKRARAIEESVLEARRRVLGPDHLSTHHAMTNLAVTLIRMEDFEATKSLQEEILAAKLRSNGEENDQVLIAMDELAETLDKLGHSEEGTAIREKALNIRRRVISREHPLKIEMLDRLVAITRDALDIGGADEVPLKYGRKLDWASFGRIPLEGGAEEYACYVDIRPEPPWLGVDIYAPLSVPEANLAETETLIEHLNAGGESGRLVLDEDDHQLIFQISTEIEDGNLTREKIDDFITRGVVQLDDACPQFWKIIDPSQQQPEKTGNGKHSNKPPKGDSTMSNMRITDVIVNWLEMQEWEERPEVDEEKQTSSTFFEFQISDDFSVKCYWEAAEKAGFIKLYMYFVDSKIPTSKLDEVIKFVNLVNLKTPIGSLMVILDDRTIRFYTAIDVEDAALEMQHLSNMFGAGLRMMKARLPQYMAICFGGKTAEEALEIESEE